MELPNGAPIGKRDLWEKVLDLQHEYDHVLRRIKFLVRKGLTSMMVLSDFLSQCIAPIQQRANTAWLYIEENDITRLERGHGTELDQKVLEAMLMKLSSDLNSDDFINPPPLCMSIFVDQATRSLLLKQMPTLDKIDIVVWHAGHISWTSRFSERMLPVAGGVRTPPRALARGKGRWCQPGLLSKRAPGHHLATLGHHLSRLPLQRRRGGWFVVTGAPSQSLCRRGSRPQARLPWGKYAA
jgi:hypothetical protein